MRADSGGVIAGSKDPRLPRRLLPSLKLGARFLLLEDCSAR
jgi:hypothetical protein